MSTTTLSSPVELLCAIDPGARGAIALFHGHEVLVRDLPHLAGEVDPDALTGLIEASHPTRSGVLTGQRTFASANTSHPASSGVLLVLEKQQYMPLRRQGVTSHPGGKGVYQKGLNYGVLLGYCRTMRAVQGWAILEVTPQAWKRRLGLSSDKEQSRAMARDLFPQLATELKYKAHEGRAEALLLGVYARRHLL